MIDSHCHLNVDDYRDDLADVIKRAEDAGVHGILVPGIGLESCERAVEIAAKYPMVRAAVGIHPHEALEWSDETERRLRDWAALPEVVAVGEIGLDFYRDWSPFDAQRHAFREQLRMAGDLEMPIIVHNRDAHEEVLTALEEHPGLTGQLHCFAGGPALAERTVAAGFHLSYTGTLTYGKGKADRVLRRVPPERLLLETDSPYMTPVPHRGQRNEPAFVTHVADALAEKLERDRREVLEMTTAAAGRLFGFPPEP
ncbi:MAG: TatD family hydrolase [Gemmatimonadetes bacterium]|nr:TatD family hydrolase [Gemmatimonadota bacterium]